MHENNGELTTGYSPLLPSATGKSEGHFPTIFTDAQPRHLIAQCVRLLELANEPTKLFQSNGKIVHLDVSNGHLRLVELTHQALFLRLVELANWERETASGTTTTSPSARIVNAVLERAAEHFPKIGDVTTVPVFGSDFRPITNPGYHEEDETYFADTDGLWSSELEPMGVDEARDIVLEVIQDFPFADDASRAHAVALMLLPFVRTALGDAPTPLHLVESPSPGTGKGRLVDTISVIASGQPCRPTSLSSSRAENAKKLTSLLLAREALIVLDNIPQERLLNDPVLACILTASTPTERRLGGNSMLELNNRAVWIATGNNPRCTMEIARRSVRIRLAADCERPWLRTDFIHPNLLAWAAERRRDIVRACISLVQAWIDCGRPAHSGACLGSFETWSSTMGGILRVAGIPGFLENLDVLYEENDGESQEWRSLIAAWWASHSATPVTAGEVLAICKEHDLLFEMVGAGSHRSQLTRLGRALQQNVDRVYDGRKIIRDTSAVRSSARYVLHPMAPEAESGAPEIIAVDVGATTVKTPDNHPPRSTTSNAFCVNPLQVDE